MTGRVLADTDVWIDFFNRPGCPAHEHLSRLIDAGQVVLAGPVLAELLQGVESAEAATLVAHFGAFPCLEMDRAAWIAAGHLGRSLRRRGRVLPMSDLMLAALARMHDCALYSRDRHFEAIPQLKRFTP